jgi:ribosomal-protein-alanine N-acetyltransferase
MEPIMFELPTARLLLRDFVEDDWAAIYAMSQSPEVIRYQSWLRLAGEEEARRWVQEAIYHNQLEPRGTYNLAIIHSASQRTIGWLGWGRPSDLSRCDYDFGYALLPDAWGQGLMTEALRGAIDYMFESLDASYVTGDCETSNRASARVMEKAGMATVEQWEETHPETGTSEAHTRYGLRREQWRPQPDLIE